MALDRAWLSATAATGPLGSGSTVKIEIGALSAGVRPDTHGASLTIMASTPDSQATETVAVIPVTFVVAPPSHGGSGAR